MELLHAGLLLLLFCSAHGYLFESGPDNGAFLQDPVSEWEKMKTMTGEDIIEVVTPGPSFLRSAVPPTITPSTPEVMKFPLFLTVPASKVHKELFKPGKGAGPLPSSFKEMLLGATVTPTTSAIPRPKLIEILCHIDRMYVRIRREFFKIRDAYKYLKLGTCPVNQGTKEHYYLLYLLKTDCGFKKESNVDELYIRNTLTYMPGGPVLREMPFYFPLQCKFPRFFHSFKVGFHPKLQGGTLFKALQPKSSFTLMPQDASGNETMGTKTYIMGQSMYFEAKRSDSVAASGSQRLYINRCFMTTSQDSNSSPKYTIIDNYGCMIDGEVTDQSKFLTGASKMAQKFRLGSLIFKDVASTSSTQKLYMHCDISLGKLTPTRRSKACNYDPTSKKWMELYGDHSVCTCCESTCSPAVPKTSRNMISSDSWKVDLSSKDGYAEIEPQMKSFVDTFKLEDPDMAEHQDFLNHWEY